MGRQERHKTKKRSWKIALVVAICAAAVIIGIAVFNAVQPKSDFAVDKLAQKGFLEGRSQEEIEELLNQVLAEGEFNVSINTNPVFADGRSEGNLRIENVPNNRYYMKVKITLDDTGDTVYESDGIMQGQYIENAPLSVDLAKGSYPATAVFTAIDPSGLEEKGKVLMNLTLQIQN